MAQDFSRGGFAVLVTTTTMIYHPDVKGRPCDRLIITRGKSFSAALAPAGKSGSITVAAPSDTLQGGERKLRGFLPEVIDTFASEGLFDLILVEADGAKHLPIKAPRTGEPVVPASAACVFGVIGLDALGSVISGETVFRTEEFCAVTGKHQGDTVDRQALVNLITSAEGLFRNAPPEAEKIVVLNKADSAEAVQQGVETGSYIAKRTSVPDRIFITSGHCTDTGGPIKALLNTEHLRKTNGYF